MPLTRHAPGTAVVVAVAAVAAAVAQLSVAAQSAPVGAVATGSADIVAANAFGLVSAGRTLVPSSLTSATVTAQLAAYNALTGSSGRHDSLTGSLREFTAVVAILGAVVLVALARSAGLRPLAALAAAAGYITPALIVAGSTAYAGVVAGTWLTLALLLMVLASRDGALEARVAALVGAALALAVAGLVAPWCLAAAPAYLGGWLLRRPSPTRRRAGLATAAVAAAVGVWWLGTIGPWVPTVVDSAGAGDLAPGRVILGVSGLALVALVTVIPRLRALAFAVAPLTAAALIGPVSPTATVLVAPLLGVLLVGAVTHAWARGVAVRRRLPRRVAGSAPVAAAVAVAVALVVLPVGPAAATDAVDHTRIATWLRDNLTPDTVVVAEPLLWADLMHDGVPTGQLQLAGDPTASVRAGGGTAVWLRPQCPSPLASFGSGPGRVAVCVLPDDAVPDAAPASDLQLRRALGAALASNPRITASPDDRALLAAGSVDLRIVAVLAAAAANFRFTIAALPDDAGDVRFGADPTSGPVRRHARLTDVTTAGIASPGTGTVAAARLRETFRLQLPQYQPLSAVLIGAVLTVGYAAPAPVGLPS